MKKKQWNPPEQLMFFPEGSRNHASHLAQQEEEKGRKMTAISGQKCLEQYGKFDRHGSLVKMFVALLIGQREWYSSKCRLTWKLKATKSHRLYFQLAVSMLPTEGTEFGLLHTPQSRDWKGEGGNQKDLNWDVKKMLLPTPTVMDTASNQTPEQLDAKRERLKERNNGKNGTKKSGNGMGITLGELMVRGLLPTPTATSDPKGGCTREDPKRQSDTLAHSIHGLMGKPGKTSQLNPRFVAEVMGFPPNWTELPFQNGEKKV